MKDQNKRSAVYPLTTIKDKLKLLSVQLKRPMYELADEAIEAYIKAN